MKTITIELDGIKHEFEVTATITQDELTTMVESIGGRPKDRE